MAFIQLLNLLFLLVAVSAVPQPDCDGVSVVVKYDTPEDDYSMSMTVDDSYGSCGPFDMYDLRKMLLGSGKMWRSTCKKTIPHVLVIEPTADCRGEEWTVQYLTFKLKGAKKVEVYVDDEIIYSQSVGLYFALTQTINKPGKSVKIVAYPKWRFSCIVLYDVQVNFCCIQISTSTTTTQIPSTTTLGPEFPCFESCIPLAPGDLISDDGITCTLIEEEAPCKWACNGTCNVDGFVGVTVIGTAQVGTSSTDLNAIDKCECCTPLTAEWEEHPVDCDGEERTLFIYRITKCECQECDDTPTTTTTPSPYGPQEEYVGYGMQPSHGYWPKYPYWYWPQPPIWPPYGKYDKEDPYGQVEQPPYGGGSYPPYGPKPPKPGPWY